MNLNIINVIIIIFITYFAYSGFKNGLIKELTTIISFISAFLLAQIIGPIIEKYLILETFIKNQPLRDKIGYLVSFIIIVYILRIIGALIEKYIDVKLKHRILGVGIGILNGILIFSLIISISKELLPSNDIHEEWKKTSYLYSTMDTLQEKYLIQYNKLKEK